MQTAHLRVKEAEATLLTSKLSYLPSLFLAPEGAASSFDRGKATQTYSLPVTASWELDIFGYQDIDLECAIEHRTIAYIRVCQ